MDRTLNINNLRVLAYANGLTSWLYRARHEFALCLATGYFDDASDMLAHGDMLTIVASDRPEIVFVSRVAGADTRIVRAGEAW